MLLCWLHHHTAAIHSRVWSGGNENQHLQFWAHGPQPEKSEVPTPGQGRVTASLRVVSRVLFRVRVGLRSTDGLVLWMQSCDHCTSLSWWRESWVQKWCSLFTGRSTFLPSSSMVTNFGQWLKEQDRLLQAAEIGFLRRVAGLCFRDGSSAIQEGLRVELLLLHIKRSQLRWFGHLTRRPPGWGVPGMSHREEADPGDALVTSKLSWLGYFLFSQTLHWQPFWN